MFHGPFTDGSSFADVARGAVNAWFESMSGFSTTGATVISTSMSPNCLPGMDCIIRNRVGCCFGDPLHNGLEEWVSLCLE